MSLTKQLKALGEGEALTLETDQQKAVYVTASRLKMKVTTERKDDKLLVTRTSKSAPTITTKEVTILDRVKALSVADRKTLFDAFELCCGMNRGDCICPEEIITPVQIVAPVQCERLSIDQLKALIAPIESGEVMPTISAPVEDVWIDDPPTYENGEKIFWHHRPKCKPVIKRREIDYDSGT